MITFVLNKAIDKQKYDDCIATSIQSKIYAFSWYLDAVTETWDMLILDDYEAVMPLPKSKKYSINYIFQPFWIQHLGIFSKNILTDNVLNEFISNIPKKIKFIDYNINVKIQSTSPKINYILPLKNSYENLLKDFSKLRKRSISKANKRGVLLKKTEKWNELLNLSKHKLQQGFKITEEASLKFEQLLKIAKKLNKLKIITAYTQDKE